MTPAAIGQTTPRVEIVTAGNEVLLGDVLDTNSHRLCRLVTALGGAVTHAVLVRDDLEAIAAEVRGVLGRAPALAFTVGGLGPTVDDMTLAGLALGLGVPLELHPGAERLVAAAYARFAAAHYEERTLVVDLQDESAIADILGEVETANPAVYVKSRAKVMGPAVRLRITLSTRGDDPAAVDALLGPPAAELLERIAAAGFGVRFEEPTPDD